MPKRKLEECLSDGQEGTTESDDSNISSQTNGSTDVPSSEKECYTQLRKRPKKVVKFDGVTVFYFPRKQGFTCVPSQGGSTLGMSEKHSIVENFSVSEYGKLQRQIHKRILKEQQKQGKLGPNKLRLDKDPENSSENESPSSDSDEDLNIDDYYFLQPVSTRQRRILLRQAGIKKIDTIEKEDCKDIRSSREVCGCDCRVYCDPMSCSCSLAGIKCQVDRLSFPCGCSKDGCANVAGRVEFNPIRVRTHFIHTLMRLELEKKGEQVTYMKQSNNCHKTSPGSSEGDTNQSPGNVESCVQDIGSDGDGVKPKEIDMTLFNSNELGSCRDCQKSELHDVVVQETKMCVGNKDHEMEACTSSRDFPLHQESHVNNIRNLGATEQGESLPQVMLFNEEEEDYHGENTTNMYQFKNSEESSYSESSDCSSEGSDETPNFHSIHMSSFQTMNHGSVEQADGSQNNQQNFCIPNDSSEYHHAANAEPEQKYHHLNSTSSGYKLEPISEILNPIRFPNYSPSSQQGWGNCETDTFNADFPNPTEQQQQDQGGYFGSSYTEDINKPTDTNGTDNNTYSYASNATENHNTQESMCIMNNMSENQNMGEQYLSTDGVGTFQDINSYNSSIVCNDMNSQSYMNGSYVESLENEIESGACDQNYTNLDMTSDCGNNMNKVLCPQESELNSAESTLKANNRQNIEKEVAEDRAVYHDLSTVTQKQEPLVKSITNGEENEKTTAEGSFSAIPIKAAEPTLLASDCSPVLTPLESKKEGMENGTSDSNSTENAQGGENGEVCGHKEGSRENKEDITQNFGEIIKESIVETVSA